jgi:hypothetical protein
MTLAPRLISALALAAIVGALFWLAPDFEAAMLGANSPQGMMVFCAALFGLFWLYLMVQGYPIAHGRIGSASTHNLDNIVSGLPAIAALFGVFLHLAGFWPVSFVNLVVALMVLAVVAYDLWILGGAAAKINRLTDEFKSER